MYLDDQVAGVAKVIDDHCSFLRPLTLDGASHTVFGQKGQGALRRRSSSGLFHPSWACCI